MVLFKSIQYSILRNWFNQRCRLHNFVYRLGSNYGNCSNFPLVRQLWYRQFGRMQKNLCVADNAGVNAKNLNCFTWTTACRTRSAGQAYIVSYVGNEGQAVSPVQQVHCPLTFCITSTAGVLSTHPLYHQHSRCIVHTPSVSPAQQVHCPLTLCITSTASSLSTLTLYH